VCPYCCSRADVGTIVLQGPDGNDLFVNGHRRLAKYCRKCKKGAVSLAGSYPPCSEVKSKRSQRGDEDTEW
jgi:hypothetical protein